MRVLAEFVGAIVLLLIFAYGVVKLISTRGEGPSGLSDNSRRSKNATGFRRKRS